MARHGKAPKATSPTATSPKATTPKPVTMRYWTARSWRFWLFHTIVAVLIMWLVASVFLLIQARNHASTGLDQLDAAQESLSAAELLRGGGRDALARAQAEFEAAHDSASNIVLEPWTVIPLVNQNVRSVEKMTAAAAKVAKVSEEAAASTSTLLENGPTTPAERLAMLAELEKVTGTAARKLRKIDLGPDFFLVGPLGDARARFVDRLRQLREALAGARAIAHGVQQLLQGPRRYLVLAANNGEMRAGSGMLLTVGVATFANGEFSVGDFEPSADFNLPAGVVTLPPEQEALWGWLHPTQEWRNLAATPRFDVTAPLAADMWQAATGEVVDGVLAVDVDAVRALLDAQGAVTVDGRTIDADTVNSFLLNEQYAGLSANDPQAVRREVIGAVAQAAIDTLQSRAWESADLVAELGHSGRGRHVLAWARNPDEQAAWAAGGVDGSLDDDSIAVSLLNVGANKLDQFVHVDADVEVDEVSDGGHDVTITIHVKNEAPTGLPSYVAGPHPDTDLVEGEYRAILTVNTPGFGSLPAFLGSEPLVATGPDGPTKVAAVGAIRLLRGAEQTLTVTFRVPAGVNELTVEPSARIPPLTWSFAGRTWSDDAPERLEW